MPPSPRAPQRRRPRFCRSALMLPAALAACAPATVGPGPSRPPAVESSASRLAAAATPPAVQAAFADEGAAWSDGHQACVARWPELRPVCPPWPVPTGAVGWNGGRAWTALPSIGQVVTLDGAASSITAGRVTAMSSTRLYREDGSALNYSGAPVAGTLGRPSAVITSGDGLDYALVAGRLFSVDRGTSGGPGTPGSPDTSPIRPPSTPLGADLTSAPERAAGAYLQATRGGAISVPFPSVDTLSSAGTLELHGPEVYRRGQSTPLSLPGPAAALGAIRGEPYVLLRRADGWQLLRVTPFLSSPSPMPAQKALSLHGQEQRGAEEEKFFI